MTQAELISKIQENTPELVCDCGAYSHSDELDLRDVRYPDSSEIVYVYHCEKCGKEIQETFYRVKVEVSEV